MHDCPGTYVLPFGKHRNKRLIDIAHEEGGLCYLRWLEQVRRIEGKNDQVDNRLRAFLKGVENYDYDIPLYDED